MNTMTCTKNNATRTTHTTNTNKIISPSKDTAIDRKNAEKFLSIGNVKMAAPLFKKLLDEGHLDVADQYNKCLNMLRRKAWKEMNQSEFERLIKNCSGYELAIARLAGAQSMTNLTSDKSIHPQHILLAECSLITDIKQALMKMRQNTDLKEIAEGWLALIKNDLDRAHTSFSEAKSKQPTRAKLGLAIVSALKGNLHSATQELSNVRKYAPNHYPILTNFMKWNETKVISSTNIDSNYIAQVIKSGSFKDLKQLNEQLRSISHPLKPWISLRLGDHFVENSDDKNAEKLWIKVLRSNPELSLDALKRLFHLGIKNQNYHNTTSYLCRIHELLLKNSSDEARRFLEICIFDIFDEFTLTELNPPIYSRTEKKWTTDEPSIEWQLFLLFQISFLLKSIHEPSEANLFGLINSKFSNDDLMIPEFSIFQSSLPILDREYSNNEKYLRTRLSLCQIYDETSEIEQSLYLLIKHHPQHKEEFLSQYINIVEIDPQNPNIIDHIKDISQHLPNSFDSSRLLMLVSKNQKQLEMQKQKYSPSLAAVLELQTLIDSKAKKEQITNAIPPLSLIGIDEEADIRFLTLIVTKLLDDYIDHGLRHKYFRSMSLCPKRMRRIYTETRKIIESKNSDSRNKFMNSQIQLSHISCFLEEWVARFPDDGYVYYVTSFFHNIIYKPFTNICEMLNQAINHMDPEDPDYSTVLNCKNIADQISQSDFFKRFKQSVS